MTALPPQYQFLNGLTPLPKMVQVAISLYGTHEVAGPGDNPIIMGWAKETGCDLVGYNHDSIPWCGLFMAVCAVRAQKGLPPSPLWAKGWIRFGRPLTPVELPSLGDVLIFSRDGGGHVTLYVGEDANYFHCLGGNQSDGVTITRIAKARLFAVRRPIYNQQPASVKPYHLSATGLITSNEA